MSKLKKKVLRRLALCGTCAYLSGKYGQKIGILWGPGDGTKGTVVFAIAGGLFGLVVGEMAETVIARLPAA